jgi:3',5'-cyclic AMP phosphodiesterase CpdA
MRRIAHISDLHFGADDPVVAEGLLRDLEAVAPHLVVVTGDLTQRARAEEFRAARAFLDAVDAPQVIVPGNHDIPLYNLAARFGWPLAGYRRWITAEPRPTFADCELAVAGVNTARSNTWKDGRISIEDIEWLRGFFAARPEGVTMVLAAHHPFIPPTNDPTAALVGRANAALAMLASCGCHLILAGHLHQAYAGDVRPHHVEIDRSILVVQAGTAISHRRREEANAYNLLTIDEDGRRLKIDVRTGRGHDFHSSGVTEYFSGTEGWRPVAESEAPSLRSASP